MSLSYGALHEILEPENLTPHLILTAIYTLKQIWNKESKFKNFSLLG
jgi:hypothetical protein